MVGKFVQLKFSKNIYGNIVLGRYTVFLLKKKWEGWGTQKYGSSFNLISMKVYQTNSDILCTV